MDFAKEEARVDGRTFRAEGRKSRGRAIPATTSLRWYTFISLSLLLPLSLSLSLALPLPRALLGDRHVGARECPTSVRALKRDSDSL